LIACRDLLQDALEGIGTQQLLQLASKDAVNGWVYWDDFLGDGDYIDGEPVIEAEDRLFSTAISLNALLDIWTEPTPLCNRSWIPSTPSSVKSTVQMAVAFLEEYVVGFEYAKENCFFSGSVKGNFALPFWYPGNLMFYPNNTRINPVNRSQITDDLYDVVSGYIPPDVYNKLLNQTWFGSPTPLVFPGFNADGTSFPFWSSPALTYAAGLGALAKYRVTSQCSQ